MSKSNRVDAARIMRGWSYAELARRADCSGVTALLVCAKRDAAKKMPRQVGLELGLRFVEALSPDVSLSDIPLTPEARRAADLLDQPKSPTGAAA